MRNTTKEYCDAISTMLDLRGIDATNDANHKALEKGVITLEQFQAGARVIVKRYMREGGCCK